jgi:hypothetical protein
MQFTWTDRLRAQLHSEAGLNLLDLLLYLSVMLAGLSFALPEFFVPEQQADANERAQIKQDLTQLREALNMLETDIAMLAGAPGPNPCVNAPEKFIHTNDCEFGLYCDNGYPGWKGPYLTDPLKDPWGQPYYVDNDYRTSAGLQRVIGSMGPNGLQDFGGRGDDIVMVLCERGK